VVDAAGHVLLEEQEEARREVARRGRGGDLIVDDGDRLTPDSLGKHGLYEVAALPGAAGVAEQPRRADDCRRRCAPEDGVFSGGLGSPVHGDRRDRVVLGVGLALLPVEDVIGADVDAARAESGGRARDVSGPALVRRIRAHGIRLTQLELVERSGVDDCGRPDLLEDRRDVVHPLNVDGVVPRPNHLVSAVSDGDEIRAELPPASEDEDSHATQPTAAS
jgi:hypothetical protein